MPTVCIKRPNRTKKRFFKPCDAARIARECIKDDPELTPEQVLACIAKGLGFATIALSRTTSVEAGVNLGKGKLTLIKIALEQIIKITPKRFSRLIGSIAAVLKIVQEIENAIDLLFNAPEQKTVDSQIPKDKCDCKDQPDTTHGPIEQV